MVKAMAENCCKNVVDFRYLPLVDEERRRRSSTVCTCHPNCPSANLHRRFWEQNPTPRVAVAFLTFRPLASHSAATQYHGSLLGESFLGHVDIQTNN
ncbi:hypothetical protein WA026_020582 [Henosepilachna vigintioctopunctata]|uniref:Uncharacterized protein n=1 Tax=Henosepilachna vigintioctopunctata TaxID=420089 RepID=A0AAW1V288_9CUCU